MVLTTCPCARTRTTAFAYLSLDTTGEHRTKPTNMAAAAEAYCVKCKAKRDMKDAKKR